MQASIGIIFNKIIFVPNRLKKPAITSICIGGLAKKKF